MHIYIYRAYTQVHNVDQLWLVLYQQLRLLAVDPRIEVRHSALRTVCVCVCALMQVYIYIYIHTPQIYIYIFTCGSAYRSQAFGPRDGVCVCVYVTLLVFKTYSVRDVKT